MGPLGPWALVRRTVCTPVVPPLTSVVLTNVFSSWNIDNCRVNRINYFARDASVWLSSACTILSCILLISNGMIFRAISEKPALVSFSKTSKSTRLSDSCYFEVFEKHTRACFFFLNYTRNHAITYTNNTWMFLVNTTRNLIFPHIYVLFSI